MDDQADLHDKVRKLEQGHAVLVERMDNTDRIINELSSDQKRIEAILMNSATRDDIKTIHDKIDKSVSGMLQAALDAVPAKQANYLSLAMILLTTVTVVIALLGAAKETGLIH